MKSKHGFITTKNRSDLMSKIKSQDTKPEILLRKELWKQGIRYRKNNKKILGTPDISIKKYKIAIFVDGEFWHGFNWNNKRCKIKSNRDYWIKKIERNIERDHIVNDTLSKHGWEVIRFWEHEIKQDINTCINKIMSRISKSKTEEW